MKKLFIPFVLVVAVAVVAAGCGGKSKNKAYAGSVTAYAAALNEICAPVNAQIKTLQPKTVAEIPDKAPQIKALIEDGVKKVENLQAPDEVKDAADEFVEATNKQLDAFDDLVNAAKDGDAAKVQEVGQQLSQFDQESDAAAEEIGADQCKGANS